jgi:outer membrane protein TolC
MQITTVAYHPTARRTMHEAVQLALQHNHDVHIAADNVEAKQHSTEVAKSAYLPSVRGRGDRIQQAGPDT